MQFNILCYGDSNTWGYIPLSGERYPASVRWTGVLAQSLGNQYKVVEEGLNGRTTALNDPSRDFLNGLTYLKPCLHSHKPLDLVILLLGTNDLKSDYGQSMADIGKHIGVLVETIQLSECGRGLQSPKVVVVAPPPFADYPDESSFSGRLSLSKEFGPTYANLAEVKGCHFLDAGQLLESSPLDGVHWSAEGHDKLGNALAKMVLELFS